MMYLISVRVSVFEFAAEIDRRDAIQKLRLLRQKRPFLSI